MRELAKAVARKADWSKPNTVVLPVALAGWSRHVVDNRKLVKLVGIQTFVKFPECDSVAFPCEQPSGFSKRQPAHFVMFMGQIKFLTA